MGSRERAPEHAVLADTIGEEFAQEVSWAIAKDHSKEGTGLNIHQDNHDVLETSSKDASVDALWSA